MDIEIKIGRDVEGGSVLRVQEEYKRVSRFHATLKWHDGQLTIVDNDSANGTFVNGRRVASAKVGENDRVFLGGTNPGDYQLDLHKMVEQCTQYELKSKTDFTEEFKDLKRAYIRYQEEVAELKANVAKKSQTPKLIITIIPSVVTILLAVFLPFGPETMALRMVVGSLGPVLSTIIGFTTLGKNSNDITEELTDLQIKYQQKYKCPKCGKEYNIAAMHWKKLEAGGECPYKCGAKFVK